MGVPARLLWCLAVALIGLLGVVLAIWLRDAASVSPTTTGDGVDGGPFADAPTDPEAAETRSGPLPLTRGAGLAWSKADSTQVAAEWVPSHGAEVTGAVFVALGEAMTTWRSGDAVQIAIPQLGATYPAVIDRIDSAFAGNRSYIGKLDADTRAFSFVITVGARNVFGYVGTPDGTYELVANRRFGWLMPTANMDEHVDYSKRDYLLPGETKPGVSR
ncbi:MAG: hypothetical protein OXG82_02805 [Gammaproteobacteria bacterium]|nr:hypothetical protein [Gammaproteobacteria bacterium]